MSKLCNSFVASLLTTHYKNIEKPKPVEFIDTVVEVSDDDMDELEESDNQTMKRKAYEESEKKIMEHIAKKKEADLNIENELQNLKLDEILDFCITKD